jgi:MazG family protein
MPGKNDELQRLLSIMEQLRDPETGCPWDRQQSFDTIAPYTIEEAYEVADAIRRGDLAALKDELGDLLFQVVFHARMANELGVFGFDDVVRTINRKMLRRHPHVFGDVEAADAAAVRSAWEDHKVRERAVTHGPEASALAGVAAALPALLRAQKLQRRAARVGFDWSGPEPVLDKVREEIEELEAEVRDGGGDDARLHHELGDLLFACVNLARHLQADAETALRDACERFQRRFGYIERALAERGTTVEAASLEEMDVLWERAKQEGL